VHYSNNLLDKICFNLNNNIEDHASFFAWIFSPKGEHGLNKIPLLFLLNRFFDSNIMNYEINHITVVQKKDIVNIDFILIEKSLVSINLLKNKIIIHFNTQQYSVDYDIFYNKLLLDLYNMTIKYEGKIIIRTFINESKLIRKYIMSKSHKGEQGKEKLLKSPLSLKYNLTEENILDFILKVIEKTGEFLSYQEIVQKQNKIQNTIYGPILKKHQFNTYGYKLNRAKYVKPDILIMGSSRSCPFQEKYFNHSFYNASLVMQSMQHGYQFLKDLFLSHRPKHIVLCIEFWWFNNKTFSEIEHLPLLNENDHFDYDSINKFYEYYHDSLITDVIIEDLLHNKKYTKNSNANTIGLRAKSNSEGFFSDGYYLHAGSILDFPLNSSQKDIKCEQYIENSFFHFEKSTTLDKEKINIFFNIIDYCKKNNVEITVLSTPISDKIFNRLMIGDDYSYIPQFVELMRTQNKFEFFDYLNPKKIKIIQDEFRDCFHAGDIAYMKILKDLYINTNTTLNKYINIKYINESLKTNQGKIIEEKGDLQ